MEGRERFWKPRSISLLESQFRIQNNNEVTVLAKPQIIITKMDKFCRDFQDAQMLQNEQSTLISEPVQPQTLQRCGLESVPEEEKTQPTGLPLNEKINKLQKDQNRLIKKKIFRKDKQFVSLQQLTQISPVHFPALSLSSTHIAPLAIGLFNMQPQLAQLLQLETELLGQPQFIKQHTLPLNEKGFLLILCTDTSKPKFIEDYFIVCRYEKGNYYIQEKAYELWQVTEVLLQILRSRFFLHTPKWRTGLLWIFVPESLKSQCNYLKPKHGQQIQICPFSSVSKINLNFLKVFKAAVVLTSYKQLQHFEQLLRGKHRDQVALYLLTRAPHKLNIHSCLQGVCHRISLILAVVQRLLEPQFSLIRPVVHSNPDYQILLQDSSAPAMLQLAAVLSRTHSNLLPFSQLTLLPTSPFVLVLHYFKAHYFLKLLHQHQHAFFVVYSPSPSVFLESFRLVKNLLLVSSRPQEIGQKIGEFKMRKACSKIQPLFHAVQNLSQNLDRTLAHCPRVILFRRQNLQSVHRIMVPTVVVADVRTVLRLSLSENKMVVFIEFGGQLRQNTLGNIIGRAFDSSQVLQYIQEITSQQPTNEQVFINEDIQPFLQTVAFKASIPSVPNHHDLVQVSMAHTLILSEQDLSVMQSKDCQSQLVVLARHPCDYLRGLPDFKRLKMVVSCQKLLSKLRRKLEKGLPRNIDKVIFDQFSFQQAQWLKSKVIPSFPYFTFIPLSRLEELGLYWQDCPLILTANPSVGRLVQLHNRSPFSKILLLSNSSSQQPFRQKRNYLEIVIARNLKKKIQEVCLSSKQKPGVLVAKPKFSQSVHRICRRFSIKNKSFLIKPASKSVSKIIRPR